VGIVVLDLLALKRIHRHIVTRINSTGIESMYLSTSWTPHMCWHDSAVHSLKKKKKKPHNNKLNFQLKFLMYPDDENMIKVNGCVRVSYDCGSPLALHSCS
jgi:hypothetical protein